jgi:hypothetical protein
MSHKFLYIVQALRHIRQIAHESSGEMPYGGGRQPAVLRTFSQRLSRFVAVFYVLVYHPGRCNLLRDQYTYHV